MSPPVVVIGQLARDLVLCVDAVPDAGRSSDVGTRRELLGGKGGNIAVGFAQLGEPVALIGVVGDDAVGPFLLDQCERDGIDTQAVVRRAGSESALMVDIVTGDGRWRYLESVPPGTLLTDADVRSAGELLRGASTVVLQLQQPATAVLAALDLVTPQCRLILDGVPAADDRSRRRLLEAATVLRCDAHEAELIAKRGISDQDVARSVARDFLEAGPAMVVLAVGEEGNLAVWSDGEVMVPLIDASEVVDTTGGGDAFVAALSWSLAGGADPEHAVQLATAAAGLTVGHAGGRPELSATAVERLAARSSSGGERAR
jgi:ribokinase